MPDTTERFWEALAELADLASTVSPTPYDIDRFVEDRAAILRKYGITKREWEAFESATFDLWPYEGYC